MLRGAVIALKYALFAAVATGVNLSSQWVGLQLYSGPWSLAAAMAAGTATGLAAKYLLDKQWIFYDADSGVSAHARKFSLYTVMGAVTTAIFWGMELTFNAIDSGNRSRFLGAVLGLAIGYFVKYHLDRRFVFEPGR